MNIDDSIKIRKIIPAIGYVLAALSYFVLDKLTSVLIPVTIQETIVICAIIIVIGLFCWFIVFIIMKKIPKYGNKSREIGLLMAKKEKEGVVCCDTDKSVLCSLMVGINEYNYAPISEKDRLYTKTYVYGIEAKGRNNKPWSEIWIFSEDLSSEINSKNTGAESVVENNIKDNKSIYTFFYLINDTDSKSKTTIEDNIHKLENSIPEENRRFVPIDVSYGYIGNHTLPLLCGSVLFGITRRDNTLDFTEGYLSIRKDENDIPIYYKMPSCMLREYTRYYKEIINKKEGGNQ